MMSSKASMQAAVVSGPQAFGLDERPIPEPEADEVRVRIEACGICGSDLHFYRAGSLPAGHTPGHEISGVIDTVGGRVRDLAPGDRVAVEPLLSCGECSECLAGRDSICRHMQLLGVHRPGGLAEYIVVPDFRAHKLAPDLTASVAAMTEPVAVAVHGLVQGRFEKDQRVLVLGSGTVGLVSILTACSLGAGEVWATARHAHQAELARRMGATRILAESEAGPTPLRNLGLEHKIDLAIETVGGNANTLEAACAAVRPGGRVSVLGLFQGPVSLPGASLVIKEITLSGSNCYGRPPHQATDFRVAGDLVDRERERLAELISHELPLSEVHRGFQLAADKSQGVAKVIIAPTG